jgi:hypothetical protein
MILILIIEQYRELVDLVNQSVDGRESKPRVRVRGKQTQTSNANVKYKREQATRTTCSTSSIVFFCFVSISSFFCEIEG